ncbi:hypothetical protein V8E52_011966, partial [Russula decolorans]
MPPSPLPKDRLPPAWSLTTDTPSSTGHQPTPQQNLGPDLDVHPPPNLEPRTPPNSELHPPAPAEMPIDDFLDMLMNGKRKRPSPVQPPLNQEPRPLPNPIQPPPNPEPRPLSNPIQPPPNPEPRPL